MNEVSPALIGSPLKVIDRSAQGFCKAMYQSRILKPLSYKASKMEIQPRHPSPKITAVHCPDLIQLTNPQLPFFNYELRSRFKRTDFRTISNPSISDVQYAKVDAAIMNGQTGRLHGQTQRIRLPPNQLRRTQTQIFRHASLSDRSKIITVLTLKLSKTSVLTARIYAMNYHMALKSRTPQSDGKSPKHRLNYPLLQIEFPI